MSKMNAFYAQSGGVTAVINAQHVAWSKPAASTKTRSAESMPDVTVSSVHCRKTWSIPTGKPKRLSLRCANYLKQSPPGEPPTLATAPKLFPKILSCTLKSWRTTEWIQYCLVYHARPHWRVDLHQILIQIRLIFVFKSDLYSWA